MKITIFVIAFAAIGLIIGYGIFGEIAGNYINVQTLITGPGNAIERGLYSLSGLTTMRQRILMCGLVGAIAGLVIGLMKAKK